MKVTIIYLGRGLGAGATTYSVASELRNAGILKRVILAKDIDIAERFSEEFSNSTFVEIPRKIGLKYLVLLVKFILFSFKLRGDKILVTMQHPFSILMLLWLRNTSSILHDVKPHAGDHKFKIITANFAVYFLSKKIFVFSKIQKKFLRNYFFFSRPVDVIKHPYSLHYNNLNVVEKFPKIDFLFFGRIEKYKGLNLLLEAFQYVQDQILEVNLVIGGTGRENVQTAGENIHVLNYKLEDETLVGLLRSAEVLVLPYYEATQSGVLALAAQFKCKLVITPCPGLIEQLSYTTDGFIAQDFSPQSLAKAMIAAKKSTQSPRPRDIETGVVNEFVTGNKSSLT